MRHPNNNVSKAQALGLYAYLVMNTNYHVTMSASDLTAEIAIYTETAGASMSIEYEISHFLTDGVKTRTTHLKESNCYCYEIAFPMEYYNGK